MKRVERLRILVAALPLLGGCGAEQILNTSSRDEEIASAFVVSNAAPMGLAGSNAAWISMPLGTVVGGVNATIRNVRSGVVTLLPLSSGGFDPVQIFAESGDSLAVSLERAHQEPITLRRAVPAVSRPEVVRSNPPTGEYGLAWDASFEIIFSEPLNPATLGNAVRMAQGDSAIGVLVSGSGCRVSFRPAELLEGARLYRIRVDTTIADVDGSYLASPFVVEFATMPTPPARFIRIFNLVDEVESLDFRFWGSLYIPVEQLEVSDPLRLFQPAIHGDVLGLPTDSAQSFFGPALVTLKASLFAYGRGAGFRLLLVEDHRPATDAAHANVRVVLAANLPIPRSGPLEGALRFALDGEQPTTLGSGDQSGTATPYGNIAADSLTQRAMAVVSIVVSDHATGTELRRFAGISLDVGRSTTLVLYGNDLATLKVMVVTDR